jgi:hypothetical protein
MEEPRSFTTDITQRGKRFMTKETVREQLEQLKIQLTDPHDEGPMPTEMNSFKNAIMERRKSNNPDQQIRRLSIEPRVETQEAETFGKPSIPKQATDSFGKAAKEVTSCTVMRNKSKSPVRDTLSKSPPFTLYTGRETEPVATRFNESKHERGGSRKRKDIRNAVRSSSLNRESPFKS